MGFMFRRFVDLSVFLAGLCDGTKVRLFKEGGSVIDC